MRQLIFATMFSLLVQGCDELPEPLSQPVWPETAVCDGEPGKAYAEVSAVLLSGQGGQLDADDIADMRALASEHSPEEVVCAIDALVTHWTDPKASPHPRRAQAATRAGSFLESIGTQVEHGFGATVWDLKRSGISVSAPYHTDAQGVPWLEDADGNADINSSFTTTIDTRELNDLWVEILMTDQDQVGFWEVVQRLNTTWHPLPLATGAITGLVADEVVHDTTNTNRINIGPTTPPTANVAVSFGVDSPAREVSLRYVRTSGGLADDTDVNYFGRGH